MLDVVPLEQLMKVKEVVEHIVRLEKRPVRLLHCPASTVLPVLLKAPKLVHQAVAVRSSLKDLRKKEMRQVRLDPELVLQAIVLQGVEQTLVIHLSCY